MGLIADTTASNFGRLRGSVFLLQVKNKPIPWCTAYAIYDCPIIILKLTPGSSGLRCGDHWLPSSHRGVACKARSEDGDWSAHQWPWRDDLPPLLLQPERDQPGAPEYP